MVYRGHVKKGVVVLDDATGLADGTPVTVHPTTARPKSNGKAVKSNTKSNGKRRPTLAERLGSIIGKAKHLPADASVNLDHYLYGLPKRK